MISILSKKEFYLKTPEFSESKEYDNNPGKGWYRIYSYDLQVSPNIAEMQAVCCEDEQLALVLVDIGKYKDIELDAKALDNFREIMEFWKCHNKDIILRIVYDRIGKGMESEPIWISIVKTHMQQLGVIIKEYSLNILTLQGLFVGSWGEMHSSKFLSGSKLVELYNTLVTAVENMCIISVRKPMQWRSLVKDNVINNKLGLYNDGMLGSESDFGTYETGTREAEIGFQNRICKTVPNGGEVINDNPYNDFKKAFEDMRRMHITYLHSLYDMAVLNKWKNEEFQINSNDMVNGYDYIGTHLGYRFVVRKVFLQKKGKNQFLNIDIENVGFANIYDEVKVELELRQSNELSMGNDNIDKANEDCVASDKIGAEDNSIIIKIDTDVRAWNSNTVTSLSVPIELQKLNVDNKSQSKFSAVLKMQRCKDNRAVKFANNTADINGLQIGLLTYGKASE